MENPSLKINESNLIKNLGTIFSDSSKVINELIQNASRAGASKITFHYTHAISDTSPSTLIVEDDGCGIGDLQKLLTIADSGWSLELSDCSPYGMGFLSTLFSCEHIAVASNGVEMMENTATLLNGNAAKLSDSPVDFGTRITLTGLKDKVDTFFQAHTRNTSAIEKCTIAIGYNLDVYFNDVKLDSRMSQHSLELSVLAGERVRTPCKFGFLYSLKETLSSTYVGFLQGAKIAQHQFYRATPSPEDFGALPHVIIFNNDTKARMPDRDRLIDESDVLREVNLQVKDVIKMHLNTAFNEKDALEFANDHTLVKMARSHAPYLLCQLDALPHDSFAFANKFEWDKVNLATSGIESQRSILRSDLEGKVLFAAPELENEQENLKLLYARLVPNAIFIRLEEFSNEHWLNSFTVYSLDDLDVTVEIHEPKGEALNFNGFYGFNFQTCSSMTLSGPFGDFENQYHGLVAEYGKPTMLPKLVDTETFLREYASYQKDDLFDESALDADTDELTELVLLVNSDSPQDMLKNILNNALMGNRTLLDTLDQTTFSIAIQGSTITVE